MANNIQYETVPFVTDVRKYLVIPRKIKDNMQRLLTGTDKEGIQIDLPRVLATGRDLADVRLHGSEADKNEFRGRYVHINLAVADDPNGSGEMAFKKESPLVLKLNPKTELISGCQQLTDDQYEELRNGGFVLTKEQVDAFQNNHYALPDVRESLWNYVQEDLAEEDTKDVCSTLGMDFNSVKGLWLYRRGGLRLFAVGSVVVGGSYGVSGGGGLGGSGGRLLGVVAPEALGALRQGTRTSKSNR